MVCPHVDSAGLQPPRNSQSVYREDCTQCFDSIDDPSGLNVCLSCFNGGCTGNRDHAALHHARCEHPLALNIRRTRKPIQRDEPPPKMSKLAIKPLREEDHYNTTIKVICYDCDNDDVDISSIPVLQDVIDGVMNTLTFSRKEEVKAWELELTSCEHILCLTQDDASLMQLNSMFNDSHVAFIREVILNILQNFLIVLSVPCKKIFGYAYYVAMLAVVAVSLGAWEAIPMHLHMLLI
ncbi:ubiquitin carboxyl-terminal hydrolase 14 [Coccidioides immitis RMSCC 3703]|uniref:Ubiquitin carboxyl-terminal hydrolase 14 n=1 Tax=Coccidioides immitis RMSCC 3703 TaxID=454286 RepID=A0A0J8QNG5_COCIT|nr:ubiquitin carboxyl-terminal hydrolase 14 [Coccidioides immitis RMSCC 3703]